MLTIKTNAKAFSPTFFPLPVLKSGGTRNLIISESAMTLQSEAKYAPSQNGIISFRRGQYYADRGVFSFRVSDTLSEYDMPKFGDLTLFVENAEIKEMKPNPTWEPLTFLVLHLSEPHMYDGRDDAVSINAFISEPDDIIARQKCAGDYVLYNDTFLYHLESLTEDGEYDFTAITPQNYTTIISANTASNVVKMNALTPVLPTGKDDVWTLLLYNDDPQVVYEIAENTSSWHFIGADERFFNYDGVLHAKTEAYWRTGDMRISIPMVSDFDTSLHQEYTIGEMLEAEAAAAINPVIDYEKQQFVPVYYGNAVSKINFKIRLRARDEKDERWQPEDEWAESNDGHGTPIGGMGFTWEDIYYRRKRVTETFLRVSFYDTMERANQRLLYSAKIYFNANKAYDEYITAKSNGISSPLNVVETEFSCTEKYNKDETSEGFYIHLFPSNLELNEEGIIYMKAELNNAKYGYTVPLVVFDKGTRNGYITDGDGGKKVDMRALYNDMYIPVKIDKDEKDGIYTWEIERETVKYDEGTLTITAYEPIINKENNGNS